MRIGQLYPLVAALALSGCVKLGIPGLGDDAPPARITATETLRCPPRQPSSTCTLNLPVDVSNRRELESYVRARTPRESAKLLTDALKGWSGCAAEVKPWRAGWLICPGTNENE